MSKPFPHPFGQIAARYRALRRKAPAVVSRMAVAEFKNNFRLQGLRVRQGEVIKWEPRKDGSGKGRGILIKSGALRRALRAAPTYDSARVINARPYAAIHNRGGKLSGEMRAWSTSIKRKLTRLRKSGHEAMMPARPFMVTTPYLLDKVGSYMQRELGNIFQSTTSK